MEIGKRHACPSCGWYLRKQGMRCPVCGGLPGPDGAVTASRLSEEELAAGLRSGRLIVTLSRLGMAICIAAAVVTLALAQWAVLVLSLLALVFFVALHIYHGSRMKHLVAVNIVRGALDEMFDVEAYSHQHYIGSATIGEAGLVRDWNECSGSDYVKGSYKGVQFAFSDIKLVDVQESTDSDGGTTQTRTTRFQGQWIVLDTKKAIEHPLRLRERPQRRLSGKYTKSKSDVETENETFNTKFQILTRDPHTAFYVLTPHFMETIVRLDERANARTYLGFLGQQVHVAVDNGRDSFEVKKSADVKNLPQLRTRIQGEISYIIAIVDELLQNKYLFGEEN